MVNLDTGTALTLVSEGSRVRHALKAVIGQSPMVMTQTAIAEFQQIVRTIPSHYPELNYELWRDSGSITPAPAKHL